MGEQTTALPDIGSVVKVKRSGEKFRVVAHHDHLDAVLLQPVETPGPFLYALDEIEFDGSAPSVSVQQAAAEKRGQA